MCVCMLWLALWLALCALHIFSSGGVILGVVLAGLASLLFILFLYVYLSVSLSLPPTHVCNVWQCGVVDPGTPPLYTPPLRPSLFPPLPQAPGRLAGPGGGQWRWRIIGLAAPAAQKPAQKAPSGVTCHPSLHHVPSCTAVGDMMGRRILPRLPLRHASPAPHTPRLWRATGRSHTPALIITPQGEGRLSIIRSSLWDLPNAGRHSLSSP